jgi:hypothetical protein
MNVTHIKGFGRLGSFHVTVDTFSHTMWAICQTGKASHHVKQHCLECFAIWGISHTIKTDNAPAYTGKSFHQFCAIWDIQHFMGIPYNHQG